MSQGSAADRERVSSRALVAGVVAALVGFTSTFAVLLTGLRAVGATPRQAASGLLVLSLIVGAGCLALALRYRRPLTVAWSTPGAALLVATGTVDGGWPAAVGAFLVVGALIVLTGLWARLGAVIAGIPPSIAQAMLAGVLLPLCVAPVGAIVQNPWAVVPVVLTWLVAVRLAPQWAVPLAFVAAAVVVGISLATTGATIDPLVLLPGVEFTAPVFTVGAAFGIALPLYIVTMASQNVPGVAIMRSFGYDVPWRPTMIVTGVGTMLGATAGAHTVNLAAISAALSASPDVDQEPKRRWPAGVSAGLTYVMLAAASAALVALVLRAPVGVIAAVAGIALLPALGSAVQQAVDDVRERLPAVVTFAVAASGVSVAGVSAAFWALLAGLLVRGVLHAGRRDR